MDPVPETAPEPEPPSSTALILFSDAVAGWVSAVEDLDRFFAPTIKRMPDTQEELRVIYQHYLTPWRTQVDRLVQEIEPFLTGRRMTVRRHQSQAHVRQLLERMERISAASLKRIFPGAKGQFDVLSPIPGLSDVTKAILAKPPKS
jgi:hypothetical protein